MELKEKLQNLLKTKYGIENDADLMKALEEMQDLDLGIFVNPQMEGEKSA